MATEGGSEPKVEKSQLAPFGFDYVEQKLRSKTFGILGTSSKDGRPHSAAVVYAVSPRDSLFGLYLITRPVLKKARNIAQNPSVSFAVPFPHYILRPLPPACIQFQGRAEFVPIDDPIALRAFQRSIVLRRSLRHSLSLGKSTFIKIIPNKRIFSFAIAATVWQYLTQSGNKALGNNYVLIPEARQLK